MHNKYANILWLKAKDEKCEVELELFTYFIVIHSKFCYDRNYRLLSLNLDQKLLVDNLLWHTYYGILLIHIIYDAICQTPNLCSLNDLLGNECVYKNEDML